ncbi:hypothetical protein D3C71_1437170 [compost metagenome]
MRLHWVKRASAAAGNTGLKMVPNGATTLIGRNEPSLDGTGLGSVAASSSSLRNAA